MVVTGRAHPLPVQFDFHLLHPDRDESAGTPVWAQLAALECAEVLHVFLIWSALQRGRSYLFMHFNKVNRSLTATTERSSEFLHKPLLSIRDVMVSFF